MPGTHVYILRTRLEFSSRLRRDVAKKVKIRGIIREVNDDDTFWVTHYGEPNHFTPRGQDYGLYRIKVPRAELETRYPDHEDPLELF